MMSYYHFKFKEDFLVAKTLDLAVKNENFLLIKVYYDIYRFSSFRFDNLDAVACILDEADQHEKLVHTVFILLKTDFTHFFEIHGRILVEKLQNIWQENLFSLTHVFNPILVCVCICKILLSLDSLFQNLHGKLIQTAKNYLSIATLLRKEIHNEVMLKTIYVQKMYPSPDVSLLQILYSDTTFYKDLLTEETISKIVNEMWIFKHHYTFNFLITSTAFKNLRGDLMIRETANNDIFWSLSKQQQTSFKSNENLPPNQEEIQVLKLIKMQDMDLFYPFSFIHKTTAIDYKFTNHILSFGFWSQSPAFKVLIEAVIYSAFFVFIFENLNQIFVIRRIFESFPDSILILIDGFVGLLYGYPVTPGLLESVQPWMTAHNVTDPNIEFYYASKQTTRCGVMLMFVPEFHPQCDLYEYAANNIWSACDIFFMFQYFFYFTLLGSVFEFIYAVILTKKIKVTFKMALDFIIAGANVFVQYEYYRKVYGHHAIIRDNLLTSYDEIEKTMLFFIFLMWIKFLAYLKLTNLFGYILKTFEIMVKELIYFMIIFSIIVLASALVFYDLFDSSNTRFNSFGISIRTLLEITYGQIFFTGFSSNETLASFFIAVFAILTIIVLLNLLVVILNNTYHNINERSSLENASILYESYLLRKPDKFHSALIAFPPPMNGIILIFSPFLIFKRNEKLNKLLLKVGFSIYLVPYFLLFIMANLAIVIPLCWLKYILFILINLVFKRKSLRSLVILFLWVAFGLFKLLFVFFWNDLLCFGRSIMHFSTNRDKLDEISLKEIKVLRQKVESLLRNGNFATYKQLCEAIRNELDSLNQNIVGDNCESFFGLDEENTSKKYILSKIFQGYSSSIFHDKRNANKARNLLKELEIDKMEFFSLIKQFEGVKDKIFLPRVLEFLKMLKFCKKFSMMKLSQKQEEKVVNNIQIVDVLAIEKVVLRLLSENEKHLEIQQNFQRNPKISKLSSRNNNW